MISQTKIKFTILSKLLKKNKKKNLPRKFQSPCNDEIDNRFFHPTSKLPKKCIVESIESGMFLMNRINQNRTHLASGGPASRATAPILGTRARLRANVARAYGNRNSGGQREGPTLEIIPVTILQRLRAAACARQTVEKRGTRATAVSVVLFPSRGRVRADEHQPPVVDQRLLLLTASRGTVLPSVPANHVQRLETLQLLGTTGPRVRSASSSGTFFSPPKTRTTRAIRRQ